MPKNYRPIIILLSLFILCGCLDSSKIDINISKAVTSTTSSSATSTTAAPTSTESTSTPTAVVSTPYVPVTQAIAVTNMYANGVNWNDYVVSTDSVPTQGAFSSNNGSDTACATGFANNNCVHAGAIRKVQTDETVCTGFTMTDSLGVFDWNCSLISGKAVFKSSLKETKSLAHLINASGFLNNSVSLSYNSTVLATSASSVWWNNSFALLPTSASGDATRTSLSTSGTIYVLDHAITNPKGYNITADKISIAVLAGGSVVTNSTPGSTYGVFNFSSVNFSSFEGLYEWGYKTQPGNTEYTLENDSSVPGIQIGTSSYMRIANLATHNFQWGALNIVSSNGIEVKNISDVHSLTGIRAARTVTNFLLLNYNAFQENWGLDPANGGGTENSFLTVRHAYFKDNIYSGGWNPNAICWTGSDSILDDILIDGTNSRPAASNGIQHQIAFHNSPRSYLNNIRIFNSVGPGIDFYNSADTLMNNFQIANGAYIGVQIRLLGGITLQNGKIYNNGSNGNVGGIVENTSVAGGNRYININSSNNYGNGFTLVSADSKIIGSVASSNTYNGISLAGPAGSKNIISGVTLINNTLNGLIESSTTSGNIFHNILAANNGDSGLSLIDTTTGATLSQVVSVANTNYGIKLNGASASPKVKVVGNLVVGQNGVTNCFIDSNIPNGITTSGCALAAPSTGSSRTVVFSGSNPIGFPLPITQTAYTSIDPLLGQWTDIGNYFVSWGKNTVVAFPAASQVGSCTTGNNCQKWNFALNANSSFVRGNSVDISNVNASFNAGSSCPSFLESASSIADSYSGATHFSLYGIEKTATGNGLCEAGEDCLYAPNIGAYQGEISSTLQTCNYTNSGGLNFNSMSAYQTNGI